MMTTINVRVDSHLKPTSNGVDRIHIAFVRGLSHPSVLCHWRGGVGWMVNGGWLKNIHATLYTQTDISTTYNGNSSYVAGILSVLLVSNL